MEGLRSRLIKGIFAKILVVLGLVGIYMAFLVFVILWFVGRNGRKNQPLPE